MKYFITLLTWSVIVGCSSARPVSSETNDQSACLRGPSDDASENVILEQKLTEAIKKNDAADVEQIINGKSFRCPSGLSFSNVGRNQASDAADNEEIRKLLQSAVNLSKQECRDQIIPILLNAGIPASVEQGIAVAENGCHAATEAILKITRPIGRAGIISRFSRDFPDVMQAHFNPHFSNGSKPISEQLEIFYQAASAACVTSSEDPVCKTKADLQQNRRNLPTIVKNLKAHSDFEESPAFLVEKACDVLANIRVRERNINREKQVGQVSGTVNLEVLHDNGEDIMQLKQDLREITDDYRSRTGKQIVLKCK